MTTVNETSPGEPELLRAEFYLNPWAAIGWLHDQPTIHWHDPRPGYPDPFWIVSKWSDIRAVEADPGTFTTTQGLFVTHSRRWADFDHQFEDRRLRLLAENLLMMEGSGHSRLRRLVMPAFRPREVREREAAVRRIVSGLLDEVPPGVAIDWTATVAQQVPLRFICDWLGIDTKRGPDFLRWQAAFFAALDADVAPDEGSLTEMFDFLENEVSQRRENPRADFITFLIQAVSGEDVLSDDEILQWCWSVFVGSQGNTTDLLAHMVAVLAEHPEQRQALADNPELLALGVEEILRWCTPVRGYFRTVTKDTSFRNADMAAGDLMFLSYTSANRDPDVFPNPLRFDVSRPSLPENLAFGFGPHYCAGAHIARLEARVVLSELLNRYASWELTEAPRPPLVVSHNHAGPVMAAFTPRR